MQLQTLIKERQAELDRSVEVDDACIKMILKVYICCRLTQQAESLAKVQQEQLTLIDNLSSK